MITLPAGPACAGQVKSAQGLGHVAFSVLGRKLCGQRSSRCRFGQPSIVLTVQNSICLGLRIMLAPARQFCLESRTRQWLCHKCDVTLESRLPWRAWLHSRFCSCQLLPLLLASTRGPVLRPVKVGHTTRLRKKTEGDSCTELLLRQESTAPVTGAWSSCCT